MNSDIREFQAGSAGRSGTASLDFFDCVDQIVGHLDQYLTLGFTINDVRFSPVEQGQVRHRIIVITPQGNRLLQSVDAFDNCGPILLRILYPQILRKRVGIIQFLPTRVLIEALPQFAVGAERQRPVNNADPIVRLRIIRSQLDVFLKLRYRLAELARIERLSRHLEQDRPNPVDGGKIVRLETQNLSELRDGGFAVLFSSEGAPGMYCDA